ncbi:MAG TPA: family 2 glycosyl transferase, partial [Streptomyces sp.]|nr:family 2 glycosyl transferase [Streptomyces sp.]
VLGGADGPVERRDPVQVPAFVAEESGTRDQARTLVLDSDSTAEVGYTLVRGSGVRLGDAELTAAAGENEQLDKVVANLVAGSGADQSDELGGFAVRYVLVRPGSPREVSRVLDATPGLSRLSQQGGSALWRVDRQVARVTVEAASGAPKAVAAGPVDVHTTIPSGGSGRVLRLADTADESWTATLDGKPLTPTTVDGWAQGFQLPVDGGRLDVTFDAPVSHTGRLWAQGSLAVVLVILALPGRRRDVDDDLPDEPVAVPAQDVTGDGRRARRLRAQAEAEAEQSTDPGLPPPPQEVPVAASVPQQQAYGTGVPPGEDGPAWGSDTATHAGAGAAYGQYDQQYAQQQYPAGTYDQQQYPADPYQGGQYDPYASYGGNPASYDQTYTQGYDATYDPSHGTGADSERPDGSQQ